ncbi:hypothetical protein CEXT_616261 [Caerostris extrusa]|uniref:Uncharacterized protein n=1 Tax=Caerostris extrusa TaxID=172846 RepID=A0AAV4NVQ1_CAEEX|nr:hypothetical protein CEXT_616261 [Caerostris extrusa]
MSRLGNTSSFKEIPNVLDEDLKCSIDLHYKMAAEENTMKEKTIIFQSAWRSENGCRSKSLHLLVLMKMPLRSIWKHHKFISLRIPVLF